MQEALRFVPGAVGAQGEGNRDQVVLRGNNSTADFFIDGVRDDVQYYRDFYNLDRLEILRGSNAMIFGRGGGGGVINRVTKTPDLAAQLIAADAAVDTWGSWRVAADLNQPLATGIAARLNGFYEEASNHRDFYGLTRWAVNPTLGLDLGGRGNLVLGYEHAADDRTADRGIPSQAGRPAPVSRNLFVGDPALNRSRVDVDALSLAADYRLADSLTLRHRTRWADYDKVYSNVYAATPLAADGRIGMDAYADPTRRHNLFSQTDVNWKTATAGTQHNILAGFELGRQVTRNQRINGFFDGIIPGATRAFVTLADSARPPLATFRAGPGNRSIRAQAEVAALFVQDQVKIGDHVELLGGLRYDRFELAVDNLFSGARFARVDHLWSPRLGLVVKPVANASLYASFSRSYLPQSGDQFTALDATTAPKDMNELEIYTTRPDTLFGAKFMAVAPDHPLAAAAAANNPALQDFIAECRRTGTAQEAIDKAEKKGFDTGIRAIHPLDPTWTLPVYVANFILMDYGTGAIFGCPAHDQRDLDFVNAYGLGVTPVVCPSDVEKSTFSITYEAYDGDGVLINSRFLDGMTIPEAKEEVSKRLETAQFDGRPVGKRKINFKLRDFRGEGVGGKATSKNR